MIVEKFNGPHPAEWVIKNGLLVGGTLLDCHPHYQVGSVHDSASLHQTDSTYQFSQGWSCINLKGQRKQYAILGVHAHDSLRLTLNFEKPLASQAQSFLQQWQQWSDCKQSIMQWEAYLQSKHKQSQELSSLIIPSMVCTYFSYELGSALENVSTNPTQVLTQNMPDLYAVRYRSIYVWDLIEKQAWIYAYTAQDVHVLKSTLQKGYSESEKAQVMSNIKNRGSISDSSDIPISAPPKLKALYTWEYYQACIQKIKHYIQHGEVYQINFTTPFHAHLHTVNTQSLYHSLRHINPSPFASWMQIDSHVCILSFSPERLTQWDLKSKITTAPIKGTRARVEDEHIDYQNQQALLNSIKDRAEHLMIVDLERNDLAKIAQTGSVHVPMLCTLQSFASVHHLVSEIVAHVHPQASIIDILRAILPGGSITGAPKVRAMQYISQLERAPRQVYCGAIGHIDLYGNADLSIPIRTAYVKDHDLYYYAGGGIVADSQATEEWQEMWDKTQAIIKGLSHYHTALHH